MFPTHIRVLSPYWGKFLDYFKLHQALGSDIQTPTHRTQKLEHQREDEFVAIHHQYRHEPAMDKGTFINLGLAAGGVAKLLEACV